MAMKYTKATDSEHEIKLTPSLIAAEWRSGVAYAGQEVSAEVRTAFVGNGAKIELEAKSVDGGSIDKIRDKIKNNVFVGKFSLPRDFKAGAEIYFEASLPGNGLEGQSNRIAVLPPVEVTDMKWSAAEARRGDILTLTAAVAGVADGTEVTVVIYEYDDDNVHDKIVELPAVVTDEKLSLSWAYEYHEDTDEIPGDEERQRYGGKYNPPEYFFTVRVGEKEFGRKQESGLLTFRDWIEISLREETGLPVAEAEYVVHLPDGETRRGRLDENGLAREEGIPPGKVEVEFPGLEEVYRGDGDGD